MKICAPLCSLEKKRRAKRAFYSRVDLFASRRNNSSTIERMHSIQPRYEEPLAVVAMALPPDPWVITGAVIAIASLL